MGERSKTGPEIVKCDQQALLAQLLDAGRDPVVAGAAHENRLVDLEHDVLELDTAAREGCGDAHIEITAMKVGRGHVDPDVLEGQAPVEPGSQVGRDAVQHRVRDHLGQARLVECVLEVPSGQDAAIGHAHPCKGFQPDDLCRLELDHRLVERDDPPVAQGFVDERNDTESPGDRRAHSRFERHEAAAARRLAVIEREVGVLYEQFRIGGWIAAHAAGSDVTAERMALELDRTVDRLQNRRRPIRHLGFAVALRDDDAEFVPAQPVGGDRAAQVQ